MPALEKAKLYKLDAQNNPTPSNGIEVQFNPASLRLTLQNQVEGGQARNRQRRQFTGHSSTELTFDLHFDTSDEGTTENPRSVREKTALVEQFVLPTLASRGSSRRVSPPRARFAWGGLQLDGVISSLSIDFDLFAHNGFPLRAKMSVSIKEQDGRYEVLQSQSGGAQPDQNAGASGQGGGPASGAPGSSGGGPTNRTAPALGGESLSDFAQRQGLSPDAWRGLAAGLDGTLSLAAGLEIDFNASLGVAAGIGISVGFAAAADVSLEAKVGLSAGIDAGFSLSASGGVTAALNTVEVARVEAAADQARASFEAPSPPPPPPALPPPSVAATPPASGSTPAAGNAATSSGAGAPSAVPRAPQPPLAQGPVLPRVDAPPADMRAKSFGSSIPLRPLKARAADEYTLAVAGTSPLRIDRRAGVVPVTRDPGIAPWIALPEATPDRRVADRAAGSSLDKPSCGCRGPCKCGQKRGGTPCP